MKKLSIILVVILFTPLICYAQSTLNPSSVIYPIDKKVEKCTEENFMTESMNKCTFDGIKAWNDEILKYSNQIEKILSKEEKILFNESQKEWENYYSQEKMFLYKTIYEKNGDIHTTFVLNNLYELVKYRAITLKRYLNQLTD